MAYLDYAGAGVPSPKLLENVAEQLRTMTLANPHSRHTTALSTRQIVEETRLRILEYFNTEDYDVIFTSNATHSLQIIANNFDFGVIQEKCEIISDTLPEKGPVFCYLSDSHNSVMGLREIVRNKVKNVACLKYDSVDWSNLPPISNGLFIYTAMSNFSGRKYPLENVKKLQDKGFSVCLDAAAYLSTSPLDLSKIQPHFVIMSFYKIFGYPTGLGCLLIQKVAQNRLKKVYFSGGTLAMADPFSFTSHQRDEISERFEDGTINYYSIAALREAFIEFNASGSIKSVNENGEKILKEAYKMLKSKHHWNGKPLVIVYGHDTKHYGPLITFNLLRDDGTFIGYNEVEKMCGLFGVLVRTGCFCNIGACMEHLGITAEDLHLNFLSGKKCGDEMDVHNGKPLGAVRISFGRFSLIEDVNLFEQVLDCCFLGNLPTPQDEHRTHSLADFRPHISHLFYYPVKSGHGVCTKRADLSPSGFIHDRRFLVQSLGVTLTLKKNPSMARLYTKNSGQTLELFTAEKSISLSMESTSSSQKTIVCEDRVGTYDCGDEVSRWLSQVLEMPNCRLLRAEDDSQRSLSNESPFLLINEASAQILADQISLSREEIIRRFRPNIVISGLPAFLEDSLQKILLGNHKFEVTGKCTRCEMICADPETGEKDPALIVALRNYRNRQRMTFGIYLRQVGCEMGDSLAEGDLVKCFADESI